MSAHLPLLVWLSPSFPVGAFAYSHGLEWAFEASDVDDAPGLQEWLDDLLQHGGGRNDAILLSLSYRAAREPHRIKELAELGVALAPSLERRLETVTQGNAFMLAIGKSWPCDAASAFAAAHDGDVPYPVAVGVAAAGHGIALEITLQSFLTGFVANLVSAAIRLGTVGQTEGQGAIAKLLPRVSELALACTEASLHDLGGCVFRADLSSILHETQYSRLFRS
jgi:urease accessory protein